MKRLSEGLAGLLERGEAGKNRRFHALWRDWPRAVGEDVASLCRPLGHRRGILLVATDDSVAMQELSYMVSEILARANRYLGENCFDKVQFDLLGAQIPLDETQSPHPDYYPVRYDPPAKLGGLLGKLDPASPVGRCYEKYVKFFQRSGT